MAAIVSDTTALIVLAGRQRLDLLGACFERVLLPRAVCLEWLAGDAAVEQIIARLGFLEVVAVNDSPLLGELRALLDPGEAEALTLARQQGLPLLVDERKGRTIARMMKIPVLGLVGVLLLAVARGILEPGIADALLQESIDHGFRLARKNRHGRVASPYPTGALIIIPASDDRSAQRTLRLGSAPVATSRLARWPCL